MTFRQTQQWLTGKTKITYRNYQIVLSFMGNEHAVLWILENLRVEVEIAASKIHLKQVNLLKLCFHQSVQNEEFEISLWCIFQK